MCGICGYYSFKKEISSKNILEMNKAIQHRGPDDEGFWLSDGSVGKSFSGEDSTQKIKEIFSVLKEQKSHLALGFRRLSILDLSEKGCFRMTRKSRLLSMVRFIILKSSEKSLKILVINLKVIQIQKLF
jgi:asparagine synthetase B (glutamine-hydrolysing)